MFPFTAKCQSVGAEWWALKGSIQSRTCVAGAELATAWSTEDGARGYPVNIENVQKKVESAGGHGGS